MSKTTVFALGFAAAFVFPVTRGIVLGLYTGVKNGIEIANFEHDIEMSEKRQSR